MHDAVQVRSLDLKYERRLLLTSFATRESEHATDTAGVTGLKNKGMDKKIGDLRIFVPNPMGLSSTLHSVTLLSPLITLLLLSVAPPIVTSLFAATLVVAIISACASYLWIVDSNLLLAMATAVDQNISVTSASSSRERAQALARLSQRSSCPWT